MSDDLISRKALLDSLRDNVLVDVTAELKKTIEEQPIAFDKEKVKQDLEMSSKLYSLSDKDCEFAIPQNRALKIIEQGGVE